MIHLIAKFLASFKKYPKIRRSAWVDPRASIHPTVAMGERVKIKGPVKLAKNVFLNDDVVIWGDVEIGEGTRVNPKALIQDCNHDARDISIFRSVEFPVKIGKNVLIDTCAIVCKGVITGDNAVIGAGAMVTENVPANAVVVGNPAKVVGYKNLPINL